MSLPGEAPSLPVSSVGLDPAVLASPHLPEILAYFREQERTRQEREKAQQEQEKAQQERFKTRQAEIALEIEREKAKALVQRKNGEGVLRPSQLS